MEAFLAEMAHGNVGRNSASVSKLYETLYGKSEGNVETGQASRQEREVWAKF